VLFVAALVAAAAAPVSAQQILLEPVRAGQLTLFRSLTNEKSYYYISDQPRLATGTDGKPEISFLRWVENKRSGAGAAASREGDGGGIVHALVTLEVTPEQIQEAQAALQAKFPGAQVVGPVMYENGTLGLVSNFKDPKGGLVEQVMGVGKAPLLDRQAAAVTMQLTKKGAQVLWESIQTPVPDISFTFEMQLAGVRPPVRAILEANFDQIYAHKAFAAGFASTHFGAEIEAAYDDLRRTGAIKLTQIGSDAAMDQLIQTAYAQLSKIMFESAPDILKPGMGTGFAPGAESESDSMLAKATSLLAASRADAAGTASAGPKEPSQALKDARAKATKAETDAKKAEDEAARAKKDYDAAPSGKSADGKTTDANAEKNKDKLKTTYDTAQKAAV